MIRDIKGTEVYLWSIVYIRTHALLKETDLGILFHSDKV
jgi:hypothetical protein